MSSSKSSRPLCRACAPGLSNYHDDSRNRIQDLRFEFDALNDPRYSSDQPQPDRSTTPTHLQQQPAHWLPVQLSIGPDRPIVDLRLRNTSILTTSGLDFETAYAWQSLWGELDADLTGTYIFDYSIAATAYLPKI